MRKVIPLLLIACTISCTQKSEKKEEVQKIEKLQLSASNYPLYYFTNRIAGDQADVSFLVPKGIDPAYWKPTKEEVSQLQSQDLLFINGASYESWLDKVSLSQQKIVNTSASFKDQYLEIEAGETHSHGDEEEHTHGGTAFTTWLDFSLAQKQAKAIHDRLFMLENLDKAVISANWEKLNADIKELDDQMRSIAEKDQQKSCIVSHPVYQYWSKAYAYTTLEQHWEPDEIPSNHDWHHMEADSKKIGATLIMWEASPSADIIEKMKKDGFQYVVFDPCANTPEEGDFVSVMNQNIKALAKEIM